MEKFKHSDEAAELTGFKKKFYDAIEEIANIVCEVTKLRPKEIHLTYVGDNNETLTVDAIMDTILSELHRDDIKRFGTLLCKHFPAFFTPAHYRPYDVVDCLYGGETDLFDIRILGVYTEGLQ